MVVLPLPILRSDLIRRPGKGHRFGKAGVLCRPKSAELSYQAATAADLNSVPSTSMRCMMTASEVQSGVFRRSAAAHGRRLAIASLADGMNPDCCAGEALHPELDGAQP